MTKRTRVLADHKRQGKVLVPPFTQMLGPLHEVSWVKTIMPEILWIALLHRAFGDAKAVEVITAFTRLVRGIKPEPPQKWLAASSDYSLLSNQAQTIRTALRDQQLHEPLMEALGPLVSWYPKCPLAPILFKTRVPSSQHELEMLKSVVAGMFFRSDRGPVMVQASAIWLAFDADILKVSSDISLAHFPEVERYPETDLSKKIGASIRAGLNSMFGSETFYSPLHTWPNYFWNRGLSIESCQIEK